MLVIINSHLRLLGAVWRRGMHERRQALAGIGRTKERCPIADLIPAQ